MNTTLAARLAACAAAAWGAAAAAQDRGAALIVGNESYENGPDVSHAGEALDAAGPLGRAGFSVRSGGDLGVTRMRALQDAFFGDLAGASRAVILVSGSFVHADGESWLLGADSDAPTLATADRQGLPLDTLLAMAAGAPGGAVVLVGHEDDGGEAGRGLQAGLGPVEVPQGVTLIDGAPDDVAAFARDILARPGQTAADLAARARGLRTSGYLGDLAPFLPEPAVAQPSPPPQPPTDAGDALATERAVWDTAQAVDTVAGYESYLGRYPDGLFAPAARQAIAAIRAEPARDARLAEQALALSREQRREIQRSLSILSIDPRGIDGVFGAGSRRAIAAWQGQNGHAATGYLTRDEVTQLLAQAGRRAAELEAEARARQAELERADRAYWDQTGAAGDEAGLRAYLSRYPDGLFADLAKERLAVFDEERRRAAAAEERAAWDRAVRADTVEAYRAYLAAYPRGAFAEEARLMIEARGGDARLEAARKAEEALALPAFTKKLIEGRLGSLGLKPGKVDGVFDEATRRALRRYQQARNLPVTGYVSEATLARLLADSL